MADPHIAIKLSVIRSSAEIFEHILDTMDRIISTTDRLYLGRAVINLIADMIVDVDSIYQETKSLLDAVWVVAKSNLSKYVKGTEEQVHDNVADVEIFMKSIKTFINATVERFGATSLNKQNIISAIERTNPLTEFGEFLS